MTKKSQLCIQLARGLRKKLDEDSTMNKNVKSLSSEVCVAGGTSTEPSKKKVKQPIKTAATEIPTM